MTLLRNLFSALSGIATCCLLVVTPSHAQLEQTLTLDNRARAEPATTSPLMAPLPGAVMPDPPLSKLVREVADESVRIPTIDLIAPPPDLWQRIRNGFGMPNLEDPIVTNRQAWYLNRPEYLRNTFQRSRRYLYHIVEELEKRGMPTELALLPLVESSFNPQAQSPARALGMWQFIPSTGKNYKLEQNWWLDERRDILASTTAALDYLQNIYEMNGDWHLALASYNWGEGAVARAMAKNAAQGLPTDYLSIRMPTETRYYVPKLQAIKNIIADPELYNFRLDPIPNKPYFGTVDVDRNMDVAIAARLADIPLTEFIALNPAYSRPLIPGSNENPLVLPVDKVSTFMANLEHYDNTSKPVSNWLTYQLKPKEKIDSVAARFGISGTKLRQLNGITKRTRVVPGMTLLVPGKGVLQPESIAAAMPQTREIPDKAVKGKKAAAKATSATTKRTSRTTKPVKAASGAKTKTAPKGKAPVKTTPKVAKKPSEKKN